MHQHAITIRHSNHADESAMARLAALDDRPVLDHEAMLGFVDGELKAAVDLAGGQAIADPFAHTAELLELLRLRAAQQPRSGAQGSRRHTGLSLRRIGWAS